MRESRSSGSVEGVMGNHDSYSDFSCSTVKGGSIPSSHWLDRNAFGEPGSIATGHNNAVPILLAVCVLRYLNAANSLWASARTAKSESAFFHRARKSR
jgi:hypothetical protein